MGMIGKNVSFNNVFVHSLTSTDPKYSHSIRYFLGREGILETGILRGAVRVHF